jgi:outer membrane immunogenic protein
VIRKSCLAVAVSLFTLTTAQAADIEPPAAFDWSGPYAGIIAGYSWSKFDTSPTDLPDSRTTNWNQSFDVDGALVGAEAGWNHQMDALVLGIAADASVLGTKGSSLIDLDDRDSYYVGELEWLATLRGKVGFALDNVLLFATGGVALTEAKLAYEDYDDGVLDIRFEDSDTMFGWVAGGGIEFALAPVSVKIEYLYADFGNLDFHLSEEIFGDAEVDTHILRGGVMFHL